MISFQQPYEIQCPQCETAFTAEPWVLIDAQERPDLAEAVQALTIHDVVCPRCGQAGVVPAPLLYHDATLRVVLFGVPRAMSEAEWQEMAQGLLWMLIGALPAMQRLPYLGNVQAEAGVAGVAEALRHVQPMPQTAAEALGDALGTEEDDTLPPLAEAIMNLLAAQTPADFEQILVTYPFLLDEAMDDGLAGLAEAAIEQGEIDVGQAFERARLVLGQLRATVDQVQTRVQRDPAAEAYPPAQALPAPPPVWREAVAALLRLDDPAELAALQERYPVLSEALADPWLATDEQALRDLGDLAGAQVVAESRALLRGERG